MTRRPRISSPAALVAPVSLVLAAAVGLSACSSGGSGTTTTTKPLPPLPPTVLAYVALAGAGNNLGFGDRMATVNLTAGSIGLDRKVRVGTYPDAVAVTPNDRMAYVTNYSSNDVTPVDLVTGRAERAIPAGSGPSAIAINPGGNMAYVTDAGNGTLGDSVTPIDIVTGRAEKPITVGPGPQGIAITPNGTRAYVSDAGAILSGQSGPVGNQVTPINLLTRRSGRPITVGNAPVGVAITPDGSTVFVANLNSESVTPINVSSNTAGSPIPVPGGPIAVATTKTDAWVVDTPASGFPGNNVVPIGTTSLRAGAPVRVGKGAQAIAIAPNGRTAWVACFGADTIQAVNLVARAAGMHIAVAGGPFGIAVAHKPKGATAHKRSSHHHGSGSS